MGYDGALRMWDDKLQLVSAVKCAHEGARVHCLTVGPDGNLYTGGDDKVRRLSTVSAFLSCIRMGMGVMQACHVACIPGISYRTASSRCPCQGIYVSCWTQSSCAAMLSTKTLSGLLQLLGLLLPVVHG